MSADADRKRARSKLNRIEDHLEQSVFPLLAGKPVQGAKQVKHAATVVIVERDGIAAIPGTILFRQ